ncbi:LCP family protein [Nocardia takedensis]|uniref:LCP family protein n=1 Tax=Nocardia takedensis TaxID=259390 RepID=UPI0009FCEA75|nr:LCP family protein [Nocardia takedensis]
MNGEDPQFNARRRGVPPPPPGHRGGPGQRPDRPVPPPMPPGRGQPPRPQGQGQPGPRPPQRQGPNQQVPQQPGARQQGPRRVEPTRVLRGDENHAQPLAYSRAPQEPAQRRPPQQRPPQQRPPRQQHAPTQKPEPFDDSAHAPAPARRPRRSGEVPPPPSRSGPGQQGGQPRPPRRRRKLHLFRWSLVILLALILAVVGAVVHLDGKLVRIDALTDYTDRVGDTPGTNWLLVGSDGRGGLSSEQEQELATGGEVGPERTDTIMLVHIPESGNTTLISLPRDSYVSIPGNGRDKLNAAFAIGGPQLLVQTVETATGLHIDHYAQVGFAGFAGIVDALGGIDVCVPQAIDDPLAGINLQPGCQKLDGPTALGFVRTRATALADIDRMNNQRLFMAALLKKATSGSTLANPFTLWPLAGDTVGSLKVDEGDHLWHLGKLGWSLRGDTVATTVPIGGFEDTASGNVVVWDKTKASRFFEALAADRPVPEDLLTN